MEVLNQKELYLLDTSIKNNNKINNVYTTKQ